MGTRDTAFSDVVRSVRFFAFLLLAFAILGTAAAGCRKKSEATAEPAPDPPALTDATTGLLLTWIDENGEFHVEQRVTDVPPAERDVVKVRDPSHDPLSGDRIFVADLRTASPNGSYSVRIVANNEFEDIAVTRRAKRGAVLAPRGANSAPALAASEAPLGGKAGNAGEIAARPAVIIYGASWCGPCHQAAAYLKKRGIEFVEHDIEQDSSAAREMRAKLTKAGVRGGSIPVLDVRGRILVGFDARAVDQALGQAL